MKYLIAFLFMTVSAFSSANKLDGMIDELRSGELSLETVSALVLLQDPALRMGYGLCEASGQPLCKPDGSLGYGLCEVADGTLCKKNGSLGYGLCMLSGSKNCREKGSLGYGLCVLAGEKNCRAK